MLSKERQAGTDAANSKNDEVYSACPAIAKPHVACMCHLSTEFVFKFYFLSVVYQVKQLSI